MNALDDFGPFFAVHTHATDAEPQAPWRWLDDLLDKPAERVATVRKALGDDVEERVAASVAHLGLAARLCSPVFATAVVSGVVLDFREAWWQPPAPGGAMLLSLVDSQPERGEPDLAEAIASWLTQGPLGRLDVSIAGFSLSEHIRWGNVASALNGALTVLTMAKPELAQRARRLLAEVLALEPLRGRSSQVDGRFRRKSCCLIYRAAPGRNGPLCGDCVLTSTN